MDNSGCRNFASIWCFIQDHRPRDSNWLDRLAGTQDEVAVGDEAATHIVTLLHEYLDVPIARY